MKCKEINGLNNMNRETKRGHGVQRLLGKAIVKRADDRTDGTTERVGRTDGTTKTVGRTDGTTKRVWGVVLILMLCCTVTAMSACSNNENDTEHNRVAAIADKVWDFAHTHPDRFTLDIRTMTEPTEGIAVGYAETQDCYSCAPISVASDLRSSARKQLDKVVRHALGHDGYVGGWLDMDNGLYGFESTKLFPGDSLGGAIRFGRENGQQWVFILSDRTCSLCSQRTYTDIPINGKVAEIVERGVLHVGTTGDYRPLSFCEPDGTYWGFGIEVAKEIAGSLGVETHFVHTSWPTLTADVLAEPQTFDLAIGSPIRDVRRC